MPRWWGEKLEAERVGMSPPEFQAWCWHGPGAYYLPRYRVAWQIEAAGERQRWADQERKAQHPPSEGWMGGKVDPADSVQGWADDGDPAT